MRVAPGAADVARAIGVALPVVKTGSARPVILALFGVSRLLGRFEQPVPARPGDGFRVSDWSIGVSTALMIIPPFTVMVFGLDLVIAVTGTVLLAGAVLLQQPIGSRDFRQSLGLGQL